MPEDKKVAMTTTNGEPESIEERILKQVNENRATLSHIKESHNFNNMLSLLAVALAILALSVTTLQLGHPKTALGIMFMGLLTFELAAAVHAGLVKLDKLLLIGALVTIVGVGMTLFTMLFYPAIIVAAGGLIITSVGVATTKKSK